MAGRIFYRERSKVMEGKKQPRFKLVAVADVNLKVYGKHLRKSELDQIEGYVQDFKDITYGWQGGLGLDIWKIFIEVNYEGNFSRFGDHINLFGKDFAFDERPARFVGTLGFFF